MENIFTKDVLRASTCCHDIVLFMVNVLIMNVKRIKLCSPISESSPKGLLMAAQLM